MVELVIFVSALGMDMSVTPPLRICVIVRLGLRVVSCKEGRLRTGCEARA